MEPVVTPAEMAAIDAAAPEPVEQLIERAAWAVARQAAVMLDGHCYGKRIAVLAGSGNNGADGRGAVRHLERRGARCTVFDVVGKQGSPSLPSSSLSSSVVRPGADFDLIIDACVGTGLGRDFNADELPVSLDRTPVLAVDIPSGIDGGTGAARGAPVCANTTISFAARKPGLIMQPGRGYAGELVVADIGLDCSRATIHHVGPDDVAEHWPGPTWDGHKWRRAVAVLGGSPGMSGAPNLSAGAALRAGAGYVSLAVPGVDDLDPRSDSSQAWPIEAVRRAMPTHWADGMLEDLERFSAAVIGPGLTVTDGQDLVRYLARSPVASVIDAGALATLAARNDAQEVLAGAPATHVLTPHDGEYARLTGRAPGSDRITAVRDLAARLHSVILLKGPTTVVAGPDGQVLLSSAGDGRLATAGTGDVLAGIVAAGLAGGLPPLLAAGLGAELHGRAAALGPRRGLVAGDLPSLVARWLSDG